MKTVSWTVVQLTEEDSCNKGIRGAANSSMGRAVTMNPSVSDLIPGPARLLVGVSLDN